MIEVALRVVSLLKQQAFSNMCVLAENTFSMLNRSPKKEPQAKSIISHFALTLSISVYFSLLSGEDLSNSLSLKLCLYSIVCNNKLSTTTASSALCKEKGFAEVHSSTHTRTNTDAAVCQSILYFEQLYVTKNRSKITALCYKSIYRKYIKAKSNMFQCDAVLHFLCEQLKD